MASRIKGRFVKDTEKSRRRKASDRLSQLNSTTTSCNSLLVDTTIPEVWSPGERRVFEPAELQQRLMDGCEFCGEELRFTRVVSETVCAMGSIIYITCDCGMLNKINSGKVHHEKGKQRTRPIFDINTKIAIAMYDTGLGPHQVNRFFTNINLPGISQTSLKKREREVFEPIKQVAKRSLDDSLEEEKKASERLSVSNSGDNVPVSVKYDMGWQKRGSGRKYNSKSGVGSMIGHLTGKLIDLDLRSTDCRICSYWEGKGKEQPKHNCTRNWYGTSKAMEPDVGLSLVQNIEEKGCTVANVIMDDDTTTIARIRSQIDHEVDKWSDMGHTRVQLGNKLYKIKEKYKKDFTADDIAHLQKCFMYAIQSHKNDPKSIAENISAIIPHSFNCHNQCNESWCKYLQNPDKYRPTIKLNNQNLKVELESVFMKYVEEKNVNKLAPCGSTKDNESFNNMVAHKAPKNKHFCASESLESRVMCAAAQKNLNFDYITQINEECGLSPGKHTTKTSQNLTRKRKLQNTLKGTTEFKRKKILKLNVQRQKQVVGEVREGVTYQTAVDILPTSAADITMISAPITIPILNSINVDDGAYARVFFDLETSSLTMDCDILQISAIYNDNLFNQYVTPTKSINKYASEVTGLTVSHNFLCYNGHRVDSCLPQQALQNFIFWLHNIPSHKLILFGHNCRRFDMPRLVNTLQQYHLAASFSEKVSGFTDTLPLFRAKFPDLKSHKQEQLAHTILKSTYNAHNASDDVKILQKLINASDASHDEVIAHSFCTESCIELCKHSKLSAIRYTSLKQLLQDKIVSSVILKRIADSGLDFNQLCLAYNRDPEMGIQSVLSEKRHDGQVRVTAHKCTAKKIRDCIANLMDRN